MFSCFYEWNKRNVLVFNELDGHFSWISLVKLFRFQLPALLEFARVLCVFFSLLWLNILFLYASLLV